MKIFINSAKENYQREVTRSLPNTNVNQIFSVKSLIKATRDQSHGRRILRGPPWPRNMVKCWKSEKTQDSQIPQLTMNSTTQGHSGLHYCTSSHNKSIKLRHTPSVNSMKSTTRTPWQKRRNSSTVK
jgi:hypothetical protein